MERRTGSTRHTGARGGARGAGVAVVVTVLVVMVAACESDPQPTPTPTPTPSSASPSPSPSASTPSPSPTDDRPAATRSRSQQGAESFARFYIERSAQAWTTPDADVLRGLATSNCKTCANLVATAEDLEEKGHKYDGVPIKVVSLKLFRGGEDEWVFDSSLREQSVKVIDRKGAVISSSAAKDLNPAIAVVWREGRWWIDAIGE